MKSASDITNSLKEAHKESVSKHVSENINLVEKQCRLMAEKLDKLGYIYALYGALDGLNLAYSNIKYFFDITVVDDASDAMQEWLHTTNGMFLAAISSLILILFSVFGNYFKDNNKKGEERNELKKFIVLLWPYCRDIMKGLKNAYKGVRNAQHILKLLNIENIDSLVLPLGLALGALASLNRIWNRMQLNERKEMLKNNNNLLEELKANFLRPMKKMSLTPLSLEGMEANRLSFLALLSENRYKIQGQSASVRRNLFLSAALGGIIDGSYLFLGMSTLCDLPLLLVDLTTLFSIFYWVVCIITRLYEEYDYQRKLLITEVKVELDLLAKELEFKLYYLNNISLISAQNDSPLMTQQELTKEIQTIYGQFKLKREELQQLSSLSYPLAFLSGLRSGLAAYGASNSILFTVASILSLTSLPLPPLVLVSFTLLGLVFLIGFTWHTMIQAQKHRTKHQHTHTTEHFDKLSQIVSMLETTKKVAEALKPEEIKTVISDVMVVDASPQFFFQEWFEIIRSFFSGIGKGAKAIDFTLNSLLERDEEGHYHDSSIMHVFSLLSALVHAFALALRAQARGFGRDKVQPPPIKEKEEGKTIVEEEPDPSPLPEPTTTHGLYPPLPSHYSFFSKALSLSRQDPKAVLSGTTQDLG